MKASGADLRDPAILLGDRDPPCGLGSNSGGLSTAWRTLRASGPDREPAQNEQMAKADRLTYVSNSGRHDGHEARVARESVITSRTSHKSSSVCHQSLLEEMNPNNVCQIYPLYPHVVYVKIQHKRNGTRVHILRALYQSGLLRTQ